MFKEIFRRTYMENIHQNVFVSKRLIPKPFPESFFQYLIFDDSCYGAYLKQYGNKGETTAKFRSMKSKDIKHVTLLLNENLEKYKIYTIFSEDEVEHWFIPVKNIIYSFVRENDDGKITDFTSFYKVEGEDDENLGYIYFNIATSMPSKKLMENTIILAE